MAEEDIQFKARAHWADGARVNSSEDAHGGTVFLLRLCQDWGINLETAMGIMAQIANEWGANGTPDLASAKAAVLRYQGLIGRGFILLDSYVRNHGDREMGERCLWALLGVYEVAGASTVDGLVKLLNQRRPVSKQALHKCLDYFQTRIPEFPLLPGQRTEAQRKNMAAAQKKIWRGPTTSIL